MSEVFNIKLISEKSHRISESMKTLCTNILFSGMDIKCITLTSSVPDEGKSFVSLELAASLAKINKHVLYIDADMRKSVLRQRHKLPVCSGLSQYLTAQATLEDIIHPTQLEKLDVISCGFYPPNPVELISGEQFSKLIEILRDEYDYIIIDTPPLGSVIDAAIISKISDGTIIVVRKDAVSYKQAQSVRDQLLKTNCKILGVIMNFIKPPKASDYGYSYGYGLAHSNPSNIKNKAPDNSANTKNSDK